MRRFGVEVGRKGWQAFTLPAGARYRSPGEIYVEGDASSASYFLAAGAISGLSGGGPVRVEGVGRASIQGDVRFAEALERMGAGISMGDNWIEAGAGARRRRQAAGDRRRLQPHPRCGHDHRGGGAVRRRHQRAAQHRQLAREGNRPHRRHGHRIAQTGRRAWRRAPISCASRRPRRDSPPASPSTPTTTIAWPCASRWRRWAASPVRINDPQCVNKTFPGVLSRRWRGSQVDAGDNPMNRRQRR